MKKLLWVGDAACPSGFAQVTHHVLNHLCKQWDVAVLGMNYRGDPHEYSYPIYAAGPGGDAFGVGRLLWVMDTVLPDVLVIQQDPWNLPLYFKILEQAPEYKAVPIVGVVPVDGLNCAGARMNKLSLAIFWTEFAEREARRGGYTGLSHIIPLGVDTDVYTKKDKGASRLAARWPEVVDGVPRDDMFVVGVVGRNQYRKRLDLTIKYFAKWIKNCNINNAWLYLHVGPTGDEGVDVIQLASYYGIKDRVMLMEPPVFYGISEGDMTTTYNCFDVFLSTTQGEGWGLPAMEAMACGVPCILPDWSAYGEWARGVAHLVLCSSTAITALGIVSAGTMRAPAPCVIGGVPDEEAMVGALNAFYRSSLGRGHRSAMGRALAEKPQYRWENIAAYYDVALREVVEDKEVRSA